MMISVSDLKIKILGAQEKALKDFECEAYRLRHNFDGKTKDGRKAKKNIK